MAESFTFCCKIASEVRVALDVRAYSLNDFDSGGKDSAEFVGIIGNQSNGPNLEKMENLYGKCVVTELAPEKRLP